MRGPLTWMVAVALLAAGAAAAAPLAPNEQAALSVYGQLPAFEGVTISPDGSRVAYLGALGDTRHVLVKDMSDGRKLLDFTAAEGQKLRGLSWADNQRVLTTVSVTTSVPFWLREYDEYFGVIAAEIVTGNAWDVLKYAGGSANNAERLSRVSGRIVSRQLDGETSLFLEGIFSSDLAWSAVDDLMQINLVKRTHKLIESRTRYGQFDRLLDERGNVTAAIEYDQEHHLWWLKVGTGGQLQPVMSGTSDIDLPDLQGFDPDGKYVWLTTWQNGERHAAAVPLHAAGAAPAAAAASGLHREQWNDELLDRRNDRVIAGVLDSMSEPRYEFVEPRLAAQWEAVRARLGLQHPRLVSYSDDFTRAVVLVQSAAGPQYLLADMASATVAALGPSYRQLPAVGEVRDIEYPAADGLAIPAYLTLPPGRQPKGLPLVVMPHGGPESRDYGGFDWWAQALAFEGYAVLQPNYRGSTLSDAFRSAGDGQWGRKMQTDLSDGVAYLAAQGVIDPTRVCIVGASYGGYAAMAGVSLQQGIYRCAVSVGGVSDLHTMVSPHAEIRNHANRRGRYIERWLGVANLSDPSVDDRSPLHHADAVRVPVLLVHGRDDMVVPYDQSRRMADALKALGKSCELVDLKAEDHWLSRSATRLQMLEATVSFLKDNNPPDAALKVDATSAH
jgi:dipeptidyl aminopeptidase/acylaminoacyl peptidase